MSKQMAHVPRQYGVSSFDTAALTAAVAARTVGARAMEPSANKTSGTMAGSSLIFSFTGMSSSRSRSW
eukprot:CAMPEP_0184207630 /NCGR_PEP_ID=MMETSP0976-20121227/11195_1 /TAXON_ID=483370 /ORGANISM="non described non described, Strain CCMP2097" /LENGTH=67 /DNA_ID=CAMNT_0026512273 /DNA_START=53 /DNA_END=253 /DNA_ORIENTATION=-